MVVFLKKNWLHIFIWVAMFFYILAAKSLHTYFFLEHGKPIGMGKSLPRETGQITFTVDGLDQDIVEKEEVYKLWGWAFSTSDATLSPHMYEREIVLISGSKTYFFPTSSVKRPDVQDAYKELNMDLSQSGFSALISKDVLPVGEYKIGIIFKDPITGLAYYTDKPKALVIRSPNGLSIVK